MQTRRGVLQSLGTAVTATSVTGCVAGESKQPGSATILGVYPGLGASRPATFGAFERWLGRSHAVVTLYYDAQRLTAETADSVRAGLTRVLESGYVPIVTWQPYAQSAAARPIVQLIADGGYDRVIDRWGDLLGSWVNGGDGRRCYFRPMPEMNGNWHPWSASGSAATPVDFVNAWRYVYERVSSAGATGDRLQWLWNPNADDVGAYRAESYYPGDEYVDWVGIDGYNFGDSASTAWQSPSAVFGPMLDRLRSLTDRPVSLPEFGCSSRRNGGHSVGAKAAWITDAYTFIQRHDVRMACWFNIDKETDWAVFGGNRGTSRYETGGAEYWTYGAYRAAVTQPWVVGGGDDEAPGASMATFTGEW